MSRGDDWGASGDGEGWLFVALGMVGFGLSIALMSATKHLGAAAIPIWGVTVGGAAWVLRGPLGDALVARIAGRRDGPAGLPEAYAAELDELRGRVGELEERLDFAERLLAERRDTPGIGPSAGPR
ncbi:MAG: hypothetical protein NW201_04390 [Gemmatimonadales bacterium]|nr:hypothetical protein [Gemmatimonadales bacterium]